MRLSCADFSHTTGLEPQQFPWLNDYHCIVRLRDLTTIHLVLPMPDEYLRGLIDHVSYGEPTIQGFAYRGCLIEQMMIDPKSLLITQAFVQSDKLRFFEAFFFAEKFSAKKELCYDANECEALVVCGKLLDGSPAISHYLPPIIEEHNGALCLLEGMHRCYSSYRCHTQQKALLIRSFLTPFPWETRPWMEMAIVDEKPPVEKRKFGGNHQHFRHFALVGLDT